MWSWKCHVGHLGAPKYHGGCLGATPPNFHFQPGSDKKWAVNTPGPCRNVETPMHSPPDKKVAVVRLNWTKFDGTFCWNPFEIISTQCIGAASQPDIKSEWGLIRVDQLWMQWGKRAPPIRLKALISISFHTEGRTMCCTSHGCNNAIPRLWQTNQTVQVAIAKEEKDNGRSIPQSDHLKQTPANNGRKKDLKQWLLYLLTVLSAFLK